MTCRGNAVLFLDLALRSPPPLRVSQEADGGDERQSPTARTISSGKARLIERGLLRACRKAVGDEICCDGRGWRRRESNQRPRSASPRNQRTVRSRPLSRSCLRGLVTSYYCQVQVVTGHRRSTAPSTLACAARRTPVAPAGSPSTAAAGRSLGRASRAPRRESLRDPSARPACTPGSKAARTSIRPTCRERGLSLLFPAIVRGRVKASPASTGAVQGCATPLNADPTGGAAREAASIRRPLRRRFGSLDPKVRSSLRNTSRIDAGSQGVAAS